MKALFTIGMLLGQVSALGVEGSSVILPAVDEAMAGTITVPGRAPFQVQYIGGGLHRVNEVMPLQAAWCGTGNAGASKPDRFPITESPMEIEAAPCDPSESATGLECLGGVAPRGLKAAASGGEPSPVIIAATSPAGAWLDGTPSELRVAVSFNGRSQGSDAAAAHDPHRFYRVWTGPIPCNCGRILL